MNKIFINCDGGARGNPGPAASAFVAKDIDNKLLHREGKFLGNTTNNKAEYEAVIMALEWLSKINAGQEVVFYLDSQLVVKQVTGEFQIKDVTLQEKARKIHSLIKDNSLNIKTFLYVPRSVNYEADALVNETLDQNIF